MSQFKLVYENNLRSRLYSETGKETIIDGTLEDGGKGEYSSPTDLFAASLASCMMTVMAIVANRKKIELKGTTIEIAKEMITAPMRRVGKVAVVINMVSGLSADQRKLLESSASACPVHKSIHPEVQTVVHFSYPD